MAGDEPWNERTLIRVELRSSEQKGRAILRIQRYGEISSVPIQPFVRTVFAVLERNQRCDEIIPCGERLQILEISI